MALLSVLLIFYILKAQEKRDIKQEEREKSYYNLINKLINKFGAIDSSEKDFKEIKRNFRR
ncbi:BhlA/UviB family holin-like peptide [Clostridium sp. DMHC 10]|uniref:BhlA/UviB family holin-like peptide n=1 Tax=Clostridium sp. DMHC 10 TaxID=747377 RepID=UPI000B1B9C76